MLESAGCSVTTVWPGNKLSLLSTYCVQGVLIEHLLCLRCEHQLRCRSTSRTFASFLCNTALSAWRMELWEKGMRSLWTFGIRSPLSRVIHTCRQLLSSFCEFWAHVSLTCLFFLDDRTFASRVVKDARALQAHRSSEGQILEFWQKCSVHMRLQTNSPGTSPEILCSVDWETRTESTKADYLPGLHLLARAKQKDTH